MSVFKYFKNIPRSPSHRATGPICNFFFQICNEVPGEKKNKPCRPLGSAVLLEHVCGFHNAREIREVLAIFFRDLMKDKLRAVGVSGRDLADDDDEYTLE